MHHTFPARRSSLRGRETNSIACHGAPGVSNTAGAALWAIDYTLQAATLGMQEVHYHQGIGFKYNFVCRSLLCFRPPLALKTRWLSVPTNLTGQITGG